MPRLRPAELDNVIKTILDTIAAPLLARHGVGYETAGALLCTAGDNPDRLATEASFASLCGTPRHAHLDRQLQATKAQGWLKPNLHPRAV